MATDLSVDMVARTAGGVYSHFETQRGLPHSMRARFFTEDRATKAWTANERLRKMVKALRLNLVDPNTTYPRADIVFLRNVMIYFDDSVKADILRRVHRAMKKDGVLIVGGGEPLVNLDVPFERVECSHCSYYKPL